MTIDVVRKPNGKYHLSVAMGTQDPVSYDDIQRGSGDPDGMLYLQSHWGGGVKFETVKVRLIPEE